MEAAFCKVYQRYCGWYFQIQIWVRKGLYFYSNHWIWSPIQYICCANWISKQTTILSKNCTVFIKEWHCTKNPNASSFTIISWWHVLQGCLLGPVMFSDHGCYYLHRTKIDQWFRHKAIDSQRQGKSHCGLSSWDTIRCKRSPSLNGLFDNR